MKDGSGHDRKLTAPQPRCFFLGFSLLLESSERRSGDSSARRRSQRSTMAGPKSQTQSALSAIDAIFASSRPAKAGEGQQAGAKATKDGQAKGKEVGKAGTQTANVKGKDKGKGKEKVVPPTSNVARSTVEEVLDPSISIAASSTAAAQLQPPSLAASSSAGKNGKRKLEMDEAELAFRDSRGTSAWSSLPGISRKLAHALGASRGL